MSEIVVGKFVSKKISKVRWKPTLGSSFKSNVESFVSGSWDDTVSKSHRIDIKRVISSA